MNIIIIDIWFHSFISFPFLPSLISRLNLCEEGEYAGKKRALCFGGRYTHYCIQDHNPCSLTQLRAIVYECTEWLSQDPLNVIVVHCKGGKGRTGMVVACLLMRLGIQCLPADALDFFAQKRTSKEEVTKKPDEKGTGQEVVKVKRQRVSSKYLLKWIMNWMGWDWFIQVYLNAILSAIILWKTRLLV